jgi:hypothetical protein
VVLLLITGCGQQTLPSRHSIKRSLSVEYPADIKVLGGELESKSSYSVLLIESAERLPLPNPNGVDPSRTNKRPKGKSFSVSALSSLLAAYEVDPENVPSFTQSAGFSHDGQIGNFHFTYQEASIESGWLTVVEVREVKGPRKDMND